MKLLIHVILTATTALVTAAMVDKKGKTERRREEEEAREALILAQAEVAEVRREARTQRAESDDKLAAAENKVRALVGLLAELGAEVESVFDESKRMTCKANAVNRYFESLSASVRGNEARSGDVTPLQPGTFAREGSAEEKTRERKGEFRPPSEERIATPRTGGSEASIRKSPASESSAASRGFGGGMVNGRSLGMPREDRIPLSRKAGASGGSRGRGRGGYGGRGRGSGSRSGLGSRGGRNAGVRGGRGRGGRGSRRPERGAHRGRCLESVGEEHL